MNLKGKIAVVTGASRGAGRGIALELGAVGATVYVTGRSLGDQRTDSVVGTVDETAKLVTERGGHGIAVQCDHTNIDEVQALFEQVKREQGRLDILVNNVWGGYENYDETFGSSFWLQNRDRIEGRWARMFGAGSYAHYLSSYFAAPMMIEQGSGLIISTSSGDSTVGNHRKYLGDLMYFTAKGAIDHVSQGIAHELRPYNITALTIYPGFMSTERVLATIEETESEELKMHLPKETPHYVGRAVVALANDPNVMEKSGQLLMVGDLAREYGFTDVDGTQPETFLLPDELLMK